MRLYAILLVAVAMASCRTNKFCTLGKNYFDMSIDTTKPYKLEGQYCISNLQDTVMDNNMAIIGSKIFDRVNGRPIFDGVVWFYGTDTTSIILDNEFFEKKIKPGKYIIEAWHAGYIGTKTKELNVRQNIKIEINFYLGTIVEH